MKIFKVVVFTLVIVFCPFQPTHAQHKVNIGIVGGLGVTHITSSSNSNSNSVLQFTGGALMEVFENEHVSFEFEVLYAPKGTEASTPTTYEKISVTYIDIPLSLKIGFPNAHFSPHLMFGPELGIQTCANAEAQFTFNGRTITYSEDISSDIEPINFSLNMGGGFDFFLSEKTTLLLDFRYSLGLTDIAKTSGNSRLTTSDVQILTGFKFGL